MKYVLAGASGFLGKALTRDLVADGHQVLRLVRRTPSASDEIRWNPATGDLDPASLRDPRMSLLRDAGPRSGLILESCGALRGRAQPLSRCRRCLAPVPT